MLIIVDKIAVSAGSFTIVLTKRGYHFCIFELNKNKNDMKAINAYAAYDAETSLKPFTFERRELGEKEVQIEII